jgi:hypothetical protein
VPSEISIHVQNGTVGSGVPAIIYAIYSRQFKVSLYKYQCSKTRVNVRDTTFFEVAVKVTIL